MTANPIDLRSVFVRPIAAGERATFDRLLIEHHYLHSATLVGESMRYVATDGHRWLALLGWSSAAFKCSSRDQWIGWPQRIQWRRLCLVANNARFLVLPECRQPHLASRALALNCRRLATDWKIAHGHAVVLAETFVDRDRFAGTCYRAAGWLAVGETKGFGRNAGVYYKHGVIKRVFVRPLHRRAQSLLTDPNALPASIIEEEGMDSLSLHLVGPGSLLEALAELPDHRKPRGIRYRNLAGLVTLASAAVLAGRRSYAAVAQWIEDVPQDLLKALGCTRSRKGPFRSPSEPTIRRTLKDIDGEEVDRIVGAWLTKQGVLIKGNAIAIDGKTLRGSHKANRKGQVHLIAALTHREGVVIAQTKTNDKSNEIPAVQSLLSSLPIEGALVTMDAMHTQKETAAIVSKKRATT